MPVELCASERAMYPSRRVYRAMQSPTLSVGCSKTREPTRVTTRTPAVGYNPGWVDPPVTALMPVSQYGRPPLAFRQLGSHCRRQCRQVESLCRHGRASAESLLARHGRAPIPVFGPQYRQFHLTAICRLPARILGAAEQNTPAFEGATAGSMLELGPLSTRIPLAVAAWATCPADTTQAHPLRYGVHHIHSRAYFSSPDDYSGGDHWKLH